ncbi:hypothetical protein DAI22_07g198700 [Oryza sativa Japonica Group]|nr:hypothetical protein DAI22_07g198700 [Oryza sativa Japonica Group]
MCKCVVLGVGFASSCHKVELTHDCIRMMKLTTATMEMSRRCNWRMRSLQPGVEAGGRKPYWYALQILMFQQIDYNFSRAIVKCYILNLTVFHVFRFVIFDASIVGT